MGDHKNILLGFHYGGVPSLNSLTSIYNFQDKPWVYAHLRDIQLKLGGEKFPLIEQEYYPDHREMVSGAQAPNCRYPCVFKVGHAHGGLGKVKVETETAYQDVASVVAVSGQYVTVEKYVEAKHDLHVFKIGDFYRAMICSHCCDCRRPSLSGNWKKNAGQSVLEEVPVEERYKVWIDQVSQMFGGLAICSLEAVVGKDDTEHIIEVNDCAMNLMGETALEDRNMIAELVIKQMETVCVPHVDVNKGEPRSGDISEDLTEKSRLSRTESHDSSVSSASGSGGSASSAYSSEKKDKDSDSTMEDGLKNGKELEGEVTMKNLRTSFAGLFGSDLK